MKNHIKVFADTHAVTLALVRTAFLLFSSKKNKKFSTDLPLVYLINDDDIVKK